MSADTNPHMDYWKVIELTLTIQFEQFFFPFFLSLPSPAYYPGLLAGWFLLVSLIPSSVCMLVRKKSDSYSWE